MKQHWRWFSGATQPSEGFSGPEQMGSVVGSEEEERRRGGGGGGSIAKAPMHLIRAFYVRPLPSP
jgi:hypothetical protein